MSDRFKGALVLHTLIVISLLATIFVV